MEREFKSRLHFSCIFYRVSDQNALNSLRTATADGENECLIFAKKKQINKLGAMLV